MKMKMKSKCARCEASGLKMKLHTTKKTIHEPILNDQHERTPESLACATVLQCYFFSQQNDSHTLLHLTTRFLLLVAMPGAPNSFWFLVVRPGAPSSVLAPSSDGSSP